MFKRIFRPREDVFARRWYSTKIGKSGYQPVCSNEWNRSLCDKSKYKCADCPNRQFKPLEYQDIYNHLVGKARKLGFAILTEAMNHCITVLVSSPYIVHEVSQRNI